MWVIGLGLLVSACSTGGTDSTPLPSSSTTSLPVPPSSTTVTSSIEDHTSMSETARAYLEEAIGLMRQYSINRDSVDWDSLQASAFAAAGGAQSASNTYQAIRLALSLLEDQHSLFFSPGEAASFTEGDAVFVTPVVEVRPNRLGFVSIGRYLGDIGGDADAYAADLAGRIEAVDREACGWIMDLRRNGGGNMWPMLAGVAPLLEQGEVGSFTYPTGFSESWVISESLALWDGAVMVDNSSQGTDYVERPIAVLISSFTGSSGEAVAVAFHGQAGVRFFGQPTAGLTTSNELVELSDGALIALTMSNFTDRLGQQYGQGIPVEPDEATADFAEAESAAVEWLLTQGACSR
jgi:C-terminal processing protease CtpA/Prc